MEEWVNALLNWYDANQRILPWRENKDPYRIWISEIMLQQTQVITVMDYYRKFMDAFPNVFSLAIATEDDVLTYWQGLGYYSRARNLRRCAIDIVNHYDGEFPKDYQLLLKLPGIGPYTAGAIASIAYDIKVPAIDGNVMRVMARLKRITADLSHSKTNRIFFETVNGVIPERAGDFNQALMELGATVCSPKNPDCSDCPINQYCMAYLENIVAMLPVKTKRIKQKPIEIAMAVLIHENKVMFMKQVETRLLNGLWILPYEEGCNDSNVLIEAMKQRFDLAIEMPEKVIGTYTHVYTHLKWHVTLYRIPVMDTYQIEFPEVKWLTENELSDYALPTVIQKAMKFDIFR